MWNARDGTNYQKNMQKVGEFNDLWAFWQHWGNLPHSDPSFFFQDTAKSEEKVPVGLNCPIEALCIFEDGVIPAWEDKVNKPGCDLFCRLPTTQNMKKIWQKTVFLLIGETFPNPETITGVRIVDRGKVFKIEIWVRFLNDQEKLTQLREKIMNEFKIEKPEDIFVEEHEERMNKKTN